MKIGELAKRSGLSVHTIRYYERIGLLPVADRDGAGHRDYDPAILTWVGFLDRLKATEMPIRDMVRYAELRAEGDQTLAARRQMLELHRVRVRTRVADLTDCLSVLDTKIGTYAEQEQRIKTHDAPHPNTPDRDPPRAGQTGIGRD